MAEARTFNFVPELAEFSPAERTRILHEHWQASRRARWMTLLIVGLAMSVLHFVVRLAWDLSGLPRHPFAPLKIGVPASSAAAGGLRGRRRPYPSTR